MIICLASNLRPPEPLEEGKTYKWNEIKDILKENEFYNNDAKRFSNANDVWEMVNIGGFEESSRNKNLKPENFNYLIYFET